MSERMRSDASMGRPMITLLTSSVRSNSWNTSWKVVGLVLGTAYVTADMDPTFGNGSYFHYLQASPASGDKHHGSRPMSRNLRSAHGRDVHKFDCKAIFSGKLVVMSALILHCARRLRAVSELIAAHGIRVSERRMLLQGRQLLLTSLSDQRNLSQPASE